jgi:hypothetical protein
MLRKGLLMLNIKLLPPIKPNEITGARGCPDPKIQHFALVTYYKGRLSANDQSKFKEIIDPDYPQSTSHRTCTQHGKCYFDLLWG